MFLLSFPPIIAENFTTFCAYFYPLPLCFIAFQRFNVRLCFVTLPLWMAKTLSFKPICFAFLRCLFAFLLLRYNRKQIFTSDGGRFAKSGFVFGSYRGAYIRTTPSNPPNHSTKMLRN